MWIKQPAKQSAYRVPVRGFARNDDVISIKPDAVTYLDMDDTRHNMAFAEYARPDRSDTDAVRAYGLPLAQWEMTSESIAGLRAELQDMVAAMRGAGVFELASDDVKESLPAPIVGDMGGAFRKLMDSQNIRIIPASFGAHIDFAFQHQSNLVSELIIQALNFARAGAAAGELTTRCGYKPCDRIFARTVPKQAFCSSSCRSMHSRAKAAA